MKILLISAVILITAGLFWRYNQTNEVTNNMEQITKYLIDEQEVDELTFQKLKERLTLEDRPEIGRTAPEPGTDKFGSLGTWSALDPRTDQHYEYSEHFTDSTVTRSIRQVESNEE